MAGVSIREAADLTGLSPKTIRRRIREGALPAHKVAERGQQVWAVDLGDLAAWAQAQGIALTTDRHGLAGTQGKDKGKDRAGTTVVNGGTTVVNGAPDRGAQGDRDRDGEVRALQDRIAELERERDWLRGLCEGLTRALPAPAAASAIPNNPATNDAVPNGNPEPPRRRRWWRWW